MLLIDRIRRGDGRIGKNSGEHSPSFLCGVSSIFIGLAIVVPWLTPEADRLAEQYHVSEDKIAVEPKPHGCDFDDAPLGNKHCHYEKSVDVTRACPTDDCRVTAVYVSWRKVEE